MRSGFLNAPCLAYTAVVVVSGALYILTCAPGCLWQDSALFVYRIFHNDLEGKLGLALSHPLYILFGIVFKQIPIGELAYRINLLSAVFAALAVANLFLIMRLWLNRWLPAILSAATLAVSWTFWQHAVIAEVYTLYAAQMLGQLLFLLQYIRTRRVKYLYLLGLLNGLAIANHMWGVFDLACYAVFVLSLLRRNKISPAQLGITVLFWLFGVSPYAYLIVADILRSHDVPATLGSALFGGIWRHEVINTSISLGTALENILLVILNFPTPNFIFFFVGLRFLWKSTATRAFANVVFALSGLYFLFAFRYTVADRYAFFLPFYCFAALLIGFGADLFLRRHKSKALAIIVLVVALLPIPIYSIAPSVARKAYPPLGQRRQRPYRDEYAYFLKPWKMNCLSAERFAKDALLRVEEGAVIYAFPTDVHTLLYAQEVQGIRPDVRIVSSFDKSPHAPAFNANSVAELIRDETAIYVVTPAAGYCPDFLRDTYEFVKAGSIYRVVVNQPPR
ncbi:MAG: DUF2723 domain-containing protein [Candidatus Eisenbacteria sp.]|nr:DUF2723 domain-containing protein [Candidatus Eisenbacteria bacterium]